MSNLPGMTFYQLITKLCDHLEYEQDDNAEKYQKATAPTYEGARDTIERTLLLHIALALERKIGEFKFDAAALLYRSLWDNFWSGLNSRLDPILDEKMVGDLLSRMKNTDTNNTVDYEPHRLIADFTSSELQSLIRRLDVPQESKEILIKSIAAPPKPNKTEEYFLFAVYCLYDIVKDFKDLETIDPEISPLFLASIVDNHRNLVRLQKAYKSIKILYHPYEEKVRALLERMDE